MYDAVPDSAVGGGVGFRGRQLGAVPGETELVGVSSGGRCHCGDSRQRQGPRLAAYCVGPGLPRTRVAWCRNCMRETGKEGQSYLRDMGARLGLERGL